MRSLKMGILIPTFQNFSSCTAPCLPVRLTGIVCSRLAGIDQRRKGTAERRFCYALSSTQTFVLINILLLFWHLLSEADMLV